MLLIFASKLTHPALENRVKFPYWGVLNYADSLCIKVSPIFYIANAKPTPVGANTPQYGNYPLLGDSLL